ncbi:hypothetical protein XELAEV_18037220mg [Xenopus laevis]|uniref:Uncharacterized protein n=1 Tax=Xenopus laevis TaxID=8355 RepID=A0A974CBY4_XENLA|nr:hypothetical protein XELAEV_18037220mg [Xenopus laevis]
MTIYCPMGWEANIFFEAKSWVVKSVANLSVITCPSVLGCVVSSAALAWPCGPVGVILQWMCPISFPTNTGAGS